MWKKVKDFVINIYNIMNEPEMLTLPSTLAYYFVLAIVPIISFLLLIATSFNLSTTFITQFIEENFSKEVMTAITPMITGYNFNFGFVFYLLMAFFIVSNGSDSIIIASNMVFNIENKNYFKRRIKACVMTVLLFVLFTFMLIVPIFGEQILNLATMVGFNNRIIDALKMLYPVLNLPITIIIMYFSIKLIYVIAPDEKIKSKYVTKGAIFTTSVWVIATLIYSYYIKNIATYNLYYAGLSNIVILMVWFYILAFVFVMGLTFNYQNINENIEKTNNIKLKELEEKVRESRNK